MCLVTAGKTDPDGDKYLAAALEGRATLVVTGDPDLWRLESTKAFEIVSPRVSLGLLGG